MFLRTLADTTMKRTAWRGTVHSGPVRFFLLQRLAALQSLMIVVASLALSEWNWMRACAKE